MSGLKESSKADQKREVVIAGHTFSVRVTFVNPPIADRSMDWMATVDGREESSKYCAHGRTAEDASHTLTEQLQDSMEDDSLPPWEGLENDDGFYGGDL